MCQSNNCGCDNTTTFIQEPSFNIDTDLEINGVGAIKVKKTRIAELNRYTISVDLPETPKIIDPVDGVDGNDGADATIAIGTVTSGTTPQVTNTGTIHDAVFNFVLPKGEKGDAIKGDKGLAASVTIGDVISGTSPKVANRGTANDAILDITLVAGNKGDVGKDGITKGINSYVFANGGTLNGVYSPVGNYTQGNFVDTGNSELKKIRINAWVTIANMRNWTTLRITSSDIPTYSGKLVSQRVKHSEGEAYVGQYEIKAYIETTDRYIGFTFADAPGGNYSSDGSQYGDYGLEVFVLD